MNTTMRHALVATTVVAGLSLLSSAASAQAAGPRWQAWVGCWTAALPGPATVDMKAAPIMCVAPTANADAVQVIAVLENKVISRDTVDASGREHLISTKTCNGSQSAHWSADERRVYLKSVSTCDGLSSTTSAILAITASGEWLDVRDVSAGGGSNVRVAHFRAAQVPAVLDSVLAGNRPSVSSAARIAAGAPVGTTAIAEAVKNAEPTVVESWILERGQQFNLDANTLVALADAGVPGNVTDAMIAESNPKEFKVDHEGINDREPTSNRTVFGGTMYDTSCSPSSRYYDPYDCRYSNYGYSYNPYGYGYNSYGYGYGYGYGFAGGYYPPLVIVAGPGTTSTGKAIKGHGYTQTSGTATGTAGTRDTRPSSSTSTNTSSSANTSSASSGSGSAASSSTTTTTSTDAGRTAKQRP